MATNRNRNNRILKALDENNRWCEKKEDIGNVFHEYFTTIYSFSSPTDMEQVLQEVDCKVSEEENLSLLQEFTTDEIKVALD